MRPILTEISSTFHSSLAVVEKPQSLFNSPLHYHPELELIYVKKGCGKRMIGYKMDTYAAGDVVFVGSNLPHEWKNDTDTLEDEPIGSQSIVAYFNKGLFSSEFYNLRESNKINALLQRAGRGIKVTGQTRDTIAAKMEALVEKKDFEKILGLMEILHILSISNELEYFVYEGYEGTVPQFKNDRLSEVFSYVTNNYSHDITLDDIARVVHLTPPAFCRLFKQKTKRPFVSYLNEVRISNACKFLSETSHNISEVAFLCGYKTLSNFNKFFKKSTGLSPKAYRERAIS